MELIWQILMLPIAFFVGRFQAGRHLRRLDEAEQRFGHIRVTNLKRVTNPQTVAGASMVMGHVVIATDYWKSFVTSLKNLVGGEMKAALSLMIRARREALVRMLDQANEMGATEVWNVRFGYVNIGMMRGGGAMQVELYAYGTAVVRAQ